MVLDVSKIDLDKFDPDILEMLGFATRDEVEKILQGCNESDKALILSQCRLVLSEVKSQIASKKPKKIESIPKSWWAYDFKKRPPTLKEFVEDPYYLGATLMPSEESEGMFPTWKDILLEDFEWSSYIHNLVITGSLGIGKTYVMVTLLLYRLTLCTLLKNPQAFFGLTRGTKIVYNILSVTKQAVNETAFGDARNFMSKSVYFIDECNFDPDSKYSGFRVELPGDTFLTAGSKGWHVLGRNVLGVALDEGNWRNEADPDTKAYDLYNEVRVRIANRFMRAGKFLPAISILASSAKDESSFTEQVIREIEKANDPIHQRVYRNAVYRIKKHVLRLTGEWFKVAYGLKTQEPYVLTGLYTEQGEPIEGQEHEPPPTGASTELVPVEYLPEFKRRTRVALQSIAGISTGGSNRFFSSTVDIERCIELAEADGVVDPCRKDSPKMLPVSMEDSVNVWDYLDHNLFLTKIQSKIYPKRHPYAKRFAHLDLATSGVAGLAVCHLIGNQRIDGVINRETGVPYSEYRLIVEYDFILTMCAGRAKPISLEKVQNFLLWLMVECGYSFGMVTADQYQSAMPLQMLQARNVPAELLSIDRDKKVYTAWRQAFQELRLRPYRQDTLVHEAENLIDGEGSKMIDHPKNGCFTGDTRIALLDGSLPTFEELSKRFSPGEKFPVYAMSKNGVCVGWGHDSRITRTKADLVEVTLDNFQVIRCTPDHLFMTLDHNWVRAENLTPDVSIMPLYRSREHRVLSVKTISEVADVWDITVDDYHNFALSSGVFVHNSKDTSDAAAGAYYNAIESDEKSSVNIDNSPSIHGNSSLTPGYADKPTVEILLPQGYSKIRSFS